MIRPRRRPPPGRALLSPVPWGLVAVATVGLAVRLSVRDSFPETAPLYYALPLPVVAAFVFVAGVLWWRLSRRVAFYACGFAAVTLVGVWIANDYFRAPCDCRPDDVRVLFWNVGRGKGGWDDITDSIRSVGADAIVLSEVGDADREFWRTRFPELEVAAAGDGLVALANGHVALLSLERLGRASVCAVVEVEVRGTPLRLVMVDLESDPRVDRRGLIKEVLRVAESGGGVPTLVMGDFNTPADSVAFGPLRASFHQSFERAGRGLLVTWPMPLPILAIDHIWVPRSMDLSCAALRWTAQSDHALVIVDLAGPTVARSRRQEARLDYSMTENPWGESPVARR